MRNREHRVNLLNDELQSYQPKKWKINVPGITYSIRPEDLVPAFSGAVGKVALVAAFAVAWSVGLGIEDAAFVTENVRLEIVIASIFTIAFSAILNPGIAPPGTLAPFIPLIPVMIASGVHPLPFGILVGLIGLISALVSFSNKIVVLNGDGVKTGMNLLFGFLGMSSALGELRTWTMNRQVPDLLIVLIISGLFAYILMSRYQVKWLVIPVCAGIALLVSLLMGVTPDLSTSIGLPMINPRIWWQDKWGIGFGIGIDQFVKAMPFAILVIVMWPIDALAIQVLQEKNYPKKSDNAIFDLNSTFIIVALRNLVGVFLGGSQISSVWRSFMIPLSIVKRPIGGSAFLLGIIGIAFGLLGFPIDIAVFPPLLWMVLLFGVYLPLMEVGMTMLKNAASAQIASICLIGGIAVGPVVGWVLAVVVENFRFFPETEPDRIITKETRRMTLFIACITIISLLFV